MNNAEFVIFLRDFIDGYQVFRQNPLTLSLGDASSQTLNCLLYI